MRNLIIIIACALMAGCVQHSKNLVKDKRDINETAFISWSKTGTFNNALPRLWAEAVDSDNVDGVVRGVRVSPGVHKVIFKCKTRSDGIIRDSVKINTKPGIMYHIMAAGTGSTPYTFQRSRLYSRTPYTINLAQGCKAVVRTCEGYFYTPGEGSSHTDGLLCVRNKISTVKQFANLLHPAF